MNKEKSHRPRIFTCTTIAFKANDWFFMRDTGLINEALINMGIDSKCILPLPYYEDDHRDKIIRASMKELRSIKWWKAQNIDQVILYSWGASRFTLIARAIKKAGIRLIIHLDMNTEIPRIWNNKIPLKKAIPQALGILTREIIRSIHLRYADLLTSSAPIFDIFEHKIFYGKSISSRGFIMPCPVAERFLYDGSKKEEIIIANACWDSPNKRPAYLTKSIDMLFTIDDKARVKIIGHCDSIILDWHKNLTANHQARVMLLGFMDNHDIPKHYQNAMISINTSLSEGCHIPSAEALCCGSSVVVTNRDELKIVQSYTKHNSGRISEEDTAESMGKAMFDELNAWRNGKRNAHEISKAWRTSFNCKYTLPLIFNIEPPVSQEEKGQ